MAQNPLPKPVVCALACIRNDVPAKLRDAARDASLALIAKALGEHPPKTTFYAIGQMILKTGDPKLAEGFLPILERLRGLDPDLFPLPPNIFAWPSAPNAASGALVHGLFVPPGSDPYRYLSGALHIFGKHGTRGNIQAIAALALHLCAHNMRTSDTETARRMIDIYADLGDTIPHGPLMEAIDRALFEGVGRDAWFSPGKAPATLHRLALAQRCGGPELSMAMLLADEGVVKAGLGITRIGSMHQAFELVARLPDAATLRGMAYQERMDAMVSAVGTTP